MVRAPSPQNPMFCLVVKLLPGGSPSEAIRAMNAIRGFLDATMNPIAAFGGLVASAAVFLFAPADYRVAYRGFRMLIHAPFIRTVGSFLSRACMTSY